MSKLKKALFAGDVSQHPATLVWQAANGSGWPVTRIEALKESKKCWVYRLWSNDERSVIGKRTDAATIDLETHVYRDLLPRLSISRLTHFFTACDGSTGFSWMFMEDASGEKPEAEDLGEVGAWLGALHGCASLEDLNGFPDRSLPRFRDELEATICRLEASIASQATLPVERDVLEACTGHLKRFTSDWEQQQAIDEMAPRTLVHGDLALKNLRIARRSEAVVSAFDWEFSGVGTPAVDLHPFGSGAPIDSAFLNSYLAAVRGYVQDFSERMLKEEMLQGRLLRLILSASWASMALNTASHARSVRYLSSYERALAVLRHDWFQVERSG